MKRKFSASVGIIALSTIAMLAFQSMSKAETPPMGGGYTDVIPIPVNDPATKAIAGALFKPPGAGPFPAVVYVAGAGESMVRRAAPNKRPRSTTCFQKASRP